MRIYQAVSSPFAVRVRIAVYAKGLTVEFAAPPDGFGSEAFKKITPLGKVPTLVCNNGTVIVESAVINEYLEEKFPDPALLPADLHARAKARMLIQMTDAYVFARYLPLFALAKTAGKTSVAVADGMDGVRQGLSVLEQTIDSGPYAVDECLSLADCALAPALFYISEYAQDYFAAADVLGDYPKLTRYWAGIGNDPSVARALADK